MIQQFSQNHLGGIDRVDYNYRFNNEMIAMRLTHQKTGANDIIELYEYDYDHVGRKTKFRHHKDGISQTVASYNYDNIGRLSLKNIKPIYDIGSKCTCPWIDPKTWSLDRVPTQNDNVIINLGTDITIPAGTIANAGKLTFKGGFLRNFGKLNLDNFGSKLPLNTTSSLTDPTIGALQSIDYKWHIRGGLRGINLDLNNNTSVGSGDVFSMKLGYETDGYFDGNIGKQDFMNTVDNVNRSFAYSYDGANRITGGTYTGTGSENYSLNSVTYDANGNIKTLSRNGYKSNSTFGVVDNLNYTYNANSNKILKVDDLANETASFKDISGNDYTYSLDGSLTSDANKGITLIEYNYLKLPKRVVQNGVTTLYQYDASGKKLKETGGTNFTDYVGNKIYKNNALYQITHDEGRIVDNQYEYNIKDHLGNLRVAFRDNGGIAEVVQANSYGIWGEDLPTLSYSKPLWKVDNFKFTGKESLQGTGFIEFGARWYDNIVPRFTTIDPLSELSRRFSPTIYANNNPLRFIDPDGMQAMSPIYVAGKFMGTDNQGFKGNPILMNSNNYSNLSIGQKDQITNGTLNHTDALKLGLTLGQKIDNLASSKGGSNVDSEVSEINSVINHIVSKTEGTSDYSPDKLHNGSVSSAYDNYASIDNQRVFGKANDGHTSEAFANRTNVNTITYNLQSWTGGKEEEGSKHNPTVANLQNIYVHEAGGHFKNGWSNSSNEHAKVVKFQMNHSSWQQTTPIHKQWFTNLLKGYEAKK